MGFYLLRLFDSYIAILFESYCVTYLLRSYLFHGRGQNDSNSQKRKGVILLAENWKSDQAIIGENIKEERKRAHMTQQQLAEEIGGACTNKVISRYENGMVEMGVQTLIDVAEALDVPVDNLMPERVRVHATSEADEISRIFSKLNPENRETLLKMARMMELTESMKAAM